jgi:N-acetylmuramoyl-L-alanine amidase
LVVIDAGHGGHDPGAISPHGGQLEKDVTLAIAKSVRDEMLKSGRVRVALTRDTDKFIVLQDHFQLARKLRADLFISIHADSAENPEATGGTVYALSEVASDRGAAACSA